MDEALAVLRTGDQPVVVLDVSGPLLEERLRGAAGQTLVAAGGDGTIHVLVQQLWQRGLLNDIVVGLLHGHFGNERGLSIPGA